MKVSGSVSDICLLFFFFFNDTATTEIYTLSLHDALPISSRGRASVGRRSPCRRRPPRTCARSPAMRSEEHTSELQSRSDLVCRLLLEKKKNELGNISLRSLKDQVTPLN